MGSAAAASLRDLSPENTKPIKKIKGINGSITKIGFMVKDDKYPKLKVIK